MKLEIASFKAEHFSEYQSWYADAVLNQHLGPMDDAWLQSVLNRTDGCTYSIFRNDELVAVVGVTFPLPGHPSYYITDFAVKPDVRGEGIGSEALMQLMKKLPLEEGQSWKAFIDVRNPDAKKFFERNGWISSNKPDADGMFVLEWRNK